MLSWFKKRKQRSKTSEEVETAEDVETQQQTTQKQASRKRKEKAPVVSETITATSEHAKPALKSTEKTKKKSSKPRKAKTQRDESIKTSRSETDKDQTEDPEEQESGTPEPVSSGVEEEAENDMCEQDDHERASVSSHDDFVGDYEFGLEGNDDVADFECLSPADIVKEQTRMIKEVAELLVVADTVAGNLLRHFKWRQERLLAAYFENPKAVLREIGQTVPKKKKQASKKTHELKVSSSSANGASNASSATLNLVTHKLSGDVECLICADDLEADECTALTCEHAFCNSCWADYLTMKITEGSVEKLTCPGLNCKLIVPDQVVGTLVEAPVFEKYVRFITKSFVESNAKCTWCPAPNCGNAITAEMLSASEHGSTVQCTCGYAFCFTCHNEAHAPATCEHVRLWAAKSRDDSETTHWLGANTKECPRCHVAVEKNGGCMHMNCRQCTHEWCWLCSRPWKGHNDYYSCNRYDKAQKSKESKRDSKKKSKIAKLEEERELQRQQLTRYLHYYERYLSHDAASKMESQIKDKAYQKMSELESGHSTRTEVQFIERASDMLLHCHTTLKWSYVYAYNLPEDGAQKHLFNYLQQELEKTTEKLAELLEAPSSIMPLKRLEAVDLTALAQTKRANLLKGVVHDEYLATN
jgi:ariadne-1